MLLDSTFGHAKQPFENGSHRCRAGRRELRILIVEDDPSIRAASAAIAKQIGLDTEPVDSLSAARIALRERTIDLVLLDIRLGAENGLALLDEIRAQSPLPVVVTTAFATVGSAIAALRAEAFDYIEKPFSVDELIGALEGAASEAERNQVEQSEREPLPANEKMALISGTSPGIQRLRRIASRVASASHPVLIQGESGTEKEMLARYIHLNGLTPSAPFVSVDCSSLPSNKLERLLFGNEQEEESSAADSMCGALVANSGGTVFLNEVDYLNLDLQCALLNALEMKGVQSESSSKMFPLTARLMAASSKRLEALVDIGGFRKDLFIRLNVINLRIAPLRERKTDIPQLANVVLERVSRGSNQSRKFARNVPRHLMEYDWPGNLAELENAVEYACLVSNRDEIQLSDLPDHIQQHTSKRVEFRAGSSSGLSYEIGIVDRPAHHANHFVQSLAEIERSAILTAIELMNGDKLRAAEMLGIGKTTLYRKLKEYGVA